MDFHHIWVRWIEDGSHWELIGVFRIEVVNMWDKIHYTVQILCPHCLVHHNLSENALFLLSLLGHTGGKCLSIFVSYAFVL